MDEEGAAGALAREAVAALRRVQGLSGVSDGAPIQAGDAHATVDMGPETDWGHKSGEGAELRLALLIRCGGEQAQRVRELTERCRAAMEGLGPAVGAWRLVTMIRLRSRIVRVPGPGWTGIVEYRARLLREA
jgi:hypothetical protein